MPPLTPPKPFRTYSDLVGILTARGMQIKDIPRAERKLAQLGYYRLSGYWYPARQFQLDAQQQRLRCAITKKPLRLDVFEATTDFDEAVALYKFDKKLRLLMLDAIERLEVNLKTVIAHEIGFHDPMAYTNAKFILHKWTKPYTNRQGKQPNKWIDWSQKQQSHITRSQEDCIQWHISAGKSIPIWVAVEAWDFGDLSKFFELLAGKYQNLILGRLGLSDAKMFSRWLQQISYLRNRCAHHTRIWNQVSPNALSPAADPYFQALNLNQHALKRMYGLISVVWFLLQRVAPGSTWIQDVAALIPHKPTMPGCTYSAMGFPNEAGFPRQLFGL
ncbi:Abi family protein [Pseudomonas sp. RSP]|uniref:Abi family protein n=1 Tax=Pseudomonas sp. RSP TaxID=3462641 RepID=UPI0040539841